MKHATTPTMITMKTSFDRKIPFLEVAPGGYVPATGMGTNGANDVPVSAPPVPALVGELEERTVRDGGTMAGPFESGPTLVLTVLILEQ